MSDVHKAADEWLFSHETRRCVTVMICAESHRVQMDDARQLGDFNSFFGKVDCETASKLIYHKLRDILLMKESLGYPTYES